MVERRTPKPQTAGQAAMNAEHAFKRRDWNAKWMAKFRALCLSFPEAIEAEQFGGPWYKAGKKPFAVYGAESEKKGDRYVGRDGACFNVSLMDQAALVEDPRFERTRYIGQHGWVTMRWTKEPDWDEVGELARSAYRKVANGRQLKALEGLP